PAGDRQRRFLDRLVERRMAVEGAGQILGGTAELHGDHDLVDQVAGVAAEHVRAEDPVGRLVGEYLDEAVGGVHGARPAVRHEGELADAVGDAGRLQFLLGASDAGDLRRGVDDARHRLVVDVAALAGQVLGDGDALLLGLVRQHRAGDRVADRVDALDVGLQVAVDLDAAALVELDADALQTQALEVGLAADGDENGVAVEGFRLATFSRLQGQLDAAFRRLGAGHLGRELEAHALAAEDALELLADLAVHRRDEAVEELDDRDLRAQPRPHRAQLQADVAAADHDQVLRHLGQRERTGRGDDALLVDRDAGQVDVGRAGRDDDVLRLVLRAVDLDLIRPDDPAAALQ